MKPNANSPPSSRPHAEALCRRFLPEGVKQNGRWRVRLVHREAEYAMNVELSGPERGSWTLEATSGHGALLDIVHKGMTTARALLEGGNPPDVRRSLWPRAGYVEGQDGGRARQPAQHRPHQRTLPHHGRGDGCGARLSRGRTRSPTPTRRRARAPMPRPSAGATSQGASSKTDNGACALSRTTRHAR